MGTQKIIFLFLRIRNLEILIGTKKIGANWAIIDSNRSVIETTLQKHTRFINNKRQKGSQDEKNNVYALSY